MLFTGFTREENEVIEERKPTLSEHWNTLGEEEKQRALTHAAYLLRYGYATTTSQEELAKSIAWASKDERERPGLTYE